MVPEKHITIDEAIALADGRYALLPETEEHIAHCPECSAMIKEFSDCKEMFAGAKDFIPAVDEAKVAEIAAKSFANLPQDGSDGALAPQKTSFWKSLAFLFKPLAAFSFGIALFIGIMLFQKAENVENNGSGIEVAVTTGAEAVAETDSAPAEDLVPGVKKSGRKIKLAKANISVVSDTYFEKIENEDVSMKSGKAKFDVVTGNDFRIDVDNKFLVRVLGTSFTLDYSDGRLSAEVFSGLVEIVEKTSGAVTQLSEKMNRTFDAKVIKEPVTIENHKIKSLDNLKKHDFVPTSGKTFLFQGREALAAGKTEMAEKLFMAEIEKGKEADKALFELVSIRESKQDYAGMSDIIRKYDSIMRGSKVYKEELMIKGCVSQKKSGSSDVPLCHDYLKEFPRSFRSREIRGMVNE